MTTLTHTPATEGKIKQLSRVAADAASKAVQDFGNFSKEGAQRVHGNPEFAARVREATILALTDLSATNRYADEEVESSYGYLSGYAPKPIAKQVRVLRELFPELGSIDESLAEADLPPNAEGWFAIPKWQTIAPTYAEAVQKVLDAIKTARNGKFYNYRDGQITNERLRQSAKTEAVFQKLGDEQKDHDILVVAAQFGLRHRGRSVRRAREVMQANEYGLGAFAVGIMILTHPDRLSHYDDLWLDCAGDEFNVHADGRFGHAPYFYFDGGKVEFGAHWIDNLNDLYGSVSGFVPQS